MPQIACPHCAELTDNGKGRCQLCKKRIGIPNWSVYRATSSEKARMLTPNAVQ